MTGGDVDLLTFATLVQRMRRAQVTLWHSVSRTQERRKAQADVAVAERAVDDWLRQRGYSVIEGDKP